MRKCEECKGTKTVGICIGCGSLEKPAHHQRSCSRPGFTEAPCPACQQWGAHKTA